MDKSDLRARSLRERALLKDSERERAARENFRKAFGEYASYFVYLSYRSEMDTRILIEELKEQGKTICVPRIEDGRMLSVPLRGRIEKNGYGIEEPEGGEEVTAEVAVVPLLAYDDGGYRLGYGGGYYDAYLAAHPEVLRVGLAFSGQHAAALPHDGWDIPLDAVVTEEGVLSFGRR